MNGFLLALLALAKLLFAGAGGYGIYLLVRRGYVRSLDMKGRIAVMVAGTVLATIVAGAIDLMSGAGQFAVVILVAMAWVIAFQWLIGKEGTSDAG